MRNINLIIIHCSATLAGKDFTVKDIDRWHKQRGFKMVGYHYIIRLDGTIETGRPLEMIGAHCTGHNAHSIGICYIGGTRPSRPPLKGGAVAYVPADTRTEAQKEALRKLIKQLREKYPGATVHGHNEYSQKECPCFKVPHEL